jgi:hypothetical protein
MGSLIASHKQFNTNSVDTQLKSLSLTDLVLNEMVLVVLGKLHFSTRQRSKATRMEWD